jgi:hypothetical protein
VTQDRPTDHSVAYDPASMATSSLSLERSLWYKRPWFLVTLAVIIIVAVSVLSDISHPITNAEDVAAQNSTIKQVNADIKQCTFGLSEAFRFYRESTTSNPSSAQHKVIDKYLVQDQTVCSFAGPSMSQLTNNLQPVETTAGRALDKMLKVTILWMDSDANGAIADIAYLFKHPGDAKTIRDLGVRENYLGMDRTLALDDLAQANSILSTNLVTLKLPALERLPGT